MKKVITLFVLIFMVINVFSQNTQTIKTYYNELVKVDLKEVYSVLSNTPTKHGSYKKYNKEGTLVQTGNYTKGIKNGVFKSFYSNGKLFMLFTYVNGKLNGNAEEHLREGDKFYLHWKKAYKNDEVVKFTSYHINGQKKVEQVMNGICNAWYPSGKLFEKYTKQNGWIEGEYVSYYENGKMFEVGNYITDKKNGEWKVFDETEKLIRTEFWNKNIKTGQWKIFYDKDWKFVSALDKAEYYRIVDFKSQAPQNVLDLAESNELFKTTNFYLTGEKQKEVFLEFESNSLHFDECFLIEVGNYIEYYKNGNKKEVGKYMINRAKPLKCDTIIYYDENTQIQKIEIYSCSKYRKNFIPKLIISKDKAQLSKDKEDYTKLVKEGDVLFNSAKFSEAIILYDKAIALFPDEIAINKKKEAVESMGNQKEGDYNAIIKNADALYEKEEYNAAMKLYKEANKMFPKKEYPQKQIKEVETVFYYLKMEEKENEEKHIDNLREVKRISMQVNSIYGGGKKKKLYNAYNILSKDLSGKIEISKTYTDKEKLSKLLLDLNKKMLTFENSNTKDIEKQLKSEVDPAKIQAAFSL